MRNIIALIVILMAGIFIIYGSFEIYKKECVVESALQVDLNDTHRIASMADHYFNEGLNYTFGWNGKEINHDEASAWYLKAAGLGDVRAQYNLANYYKNTEKDKHLARFWYSMAFDAGHAPSGVQLGSFYYFDYIKRYDKAIEIWKKASELGSLEAKVLLATHFEGKNKTQDAIFWYEKIVALSFEDHVGQDPILQKSTPDYVDRMKKHYDSSASKLDKLKLIASDD